MVEGELPHISGQHLSCWFSSLQLAGTKAAWTSAQRRTVSLLAQPRQGCYRHYMRNLKEAVVHAICNHLQPAPCSRPASPAH